MSRNNLSIRYSKLGRYDKAETTLEELASLKKADHD